MDGFVGFGAVDTAYTRILFDKSALYMGDVGSALIPVPLAPAKIRYLSSSILSQEVNAISPAPRRRRDAICFMFFYFVLICCKSDKLINEIVFRMML